ncbi:MAG TPA: hypothetical protein VN700_11385 [Vicinamibacterales bacterium]|nr:hypothetical protein [Vicinamibacterales bacterium]
MALSPSPRLKARPTRVLFAAVAVVVSFSATGDRTSACMFFETAILVNIVRPGDIAAFERGALGVIQPTYERRYLIRAYRRLHGFDTVLETSPAPINPVPQPRGWFDARERVLKTGQKVEPWRFQTDRPLANYQSFENCGAEAFDLAEQTLAARVSQHGDQSPIVAAWLRAQDTVFANCGGSGGVPVVLPEPAPAGADAAVRADRSYQTAAASFYGMQYDDAVTRFLAIGDDPASPWRHYGRYLAARSLVRRESLSMEQAPRSERDAVLERADRLLAAVEADGSIPASLRTSATRMRGLVAFRARPVQRMRDLSARLRRPGAIASQDFTDYLRGFDARLSPETEYDYAGIDRRDEYAAGDDMTDWLLVLQGTGQAAADRARARWTETRATHWLIAALWKASANTAAAPDLLRAAAAIDTASPAYATVAFLRARLLIARGDRAEASRLLAGLPDVPSPTTPSEVINLFRALRLQLAPDLSTWLRAAPRFPMSSGSSFSSSESSEKPAAQPSFDVDAALALTESFPVDRLADAAASPVLPARLRLMVATEAFTRAVQLRRDDEGKKAAELLKFLAPSIRTEMDRYLAAADSDARHYSGILTILRWPSFRNYVPLAEGAEGSFIPPRFNGPSQKLDLHIKKFWWCGFGPMQSWNVAGPYEETPVTRLPEIVYQASRIPPPAVIDPADRVRATREFEALAAFGTAPNYLAREAITWAKSRPKDPDVAEALARAVTSTQYGCSDKQTGALSRQAFTVLHRQYPATEWAKRTKYWYASPY